MADQLEQQLKLALDEFLLQELAKIPGELELSARQFFSRRFEHKMKHLLRHAPVDKPQDADNSRGEEAAAPVRFFTKGKKRFLIAAIILALLASIMSFSAAREAVISFFVHIYEKFSVIVFESAPETDTSSTFSSSEQDARSFLPTWVPPGYVQQGELTISKPMVSITYVNSQGGIIIVDCTYASALQMKIDTENATTENIYIRNSLGIYLSNKGHQSLFWKEGSYVYSLFGTITKEELLKMADSINR
jgi:hypothetical protein